MNQLTKLSAVNAKLGAPAGGQQTTRYVFDTITAAAGQTVFNFFETFSGKTDLETNLNTNKLDSAESMVIKSIYFGGNITPELDGHTRLNITVGNQVVVKDLDISPNAGNKGLSYDRLHSGYNQAGKVEIRLLTDIVIPPQVTFKATLELANPGTLVGEKLVMGLKGYGKIFSAGSTF